MAKVFLSYAREDRALAEELHQWLSADGHEIFWDHDPHNGIAVGEQWKQRIYQELHGADTVVCVVTSAYRASKWCGIEIDIAQALGRRLLPLMAEPGVQHSELTSLHHADYTTDRAAARDALTARLRSWPDDRCPFPGLVPFEVDQHQVFFGRDAETEELAKLLRSRDEQLKGAAWLVVGPSGCGKSSLVRAGLVPVMAREPGWLTLNPIMPGADPVAALVQALVGAAKRFKLGWSEPKLRHRLDEDGLAGLTEELLEADPGGHRRRLLVVVDQFEELLTRTAPGERARFVELLCPALAGPVQLVGTLRPEFLDQLQADTHLTTLPRQVYSLRPLRREVLRDVIEGPAGLAGIKVDPSSLVARLVADTDGGEALPLLAFTLNQLAAGVSRGDDLSAERYKQLGKVKGALTRQAGEALDAAAKGGRSRAEVIRGLLRLVTVDDRGRPIRWRVRRDELPAAVSTELEAFVARRLLTIDTDHDTAVIGVAHEAFLSAWPPLAEAITTSVPALRVRRAVDHAASEWHEHGSSPAWLWRGRQLAATVAVIDARICPADAASPGRRGWSRWLPQRQVLVTDRVDLDAKASDFVLASMRHDRYLRRRVIIGLSGLAIVALAIAVFALDQRSEAQHQQRIATARQLITQADAIRETDPRTALLLGIAAEGIRSGGEAQASLVTTLVSTRYAGTLADHAGPVTSMAFAPDGRTLVTGVSDGTVVLRDVTDPAQTRQFWKGHTSAVSSVAFAPDGRTLATAGFDSGTVLLWDLTNPARPAQPLVGDAGTVFSVAYSPDGLTLATGDSDGHAVLWDLANPASPRRILEGHAGAVNSVAFAPDGRTLATGGDDSTARLWDLTDRDQPRPIGKPLTGHAGSVAAVAFAPDGNTLATGDFDATVILWDLTALHQLRDDATKRACAITGRGLDHTEWDRYIRGFPYQDTCIR